ncbi:MAG: hypothetical protein AB7D29_02625 [Campylobacterales bacterium]
MVNSNTEKITFNMPVELKNQVMQLKDELKVSLSTIYNEAVKNYVQQKELERWKRAAESAAKDKKYAADMKEFGGDEGGLYEY